MRLRLADYAFLLLCFLLATATQWPAAWLAPWLERAAGGQWRLADASGTVWHGSGMLLARASDSAPWHNAQNIRWQLQWGELLSGRLSIATTLEQGGLRIVASPAEIAVQQLDAALPAAEIAARFPGAVGRFGWSGTLHARSANFRCNWSGSGCQGELELLWNDATVAEIKGAALGDYRLQLRGEGPTLRLELATLRGRLQLGGTGELTGSGINFRGEAAAPGDDTGSLNALLATLGQPSGTPGKYLIDYRGAAR